MPSTISGGYRVTIVKKKKKKPKKKKKRPKKKDRKKKLFVGLGCTFHHQIGPAALPLLEVSLPGSHEHVPSTISGGYRELGNFHGHVDRPHATCTYQHHRPHSQHRDRLNFHRCDTPMCPIKVDSTAVWPVCMIHLSSGVDRAPCRAAGRSFCACMQ